GWTSSSSPAATSCCRRMARRCWRSCADCRTPSGRRSAGPAAHACSPPTPPPTAPPSSRRSSRPPAPTDRGAAKPAKGTPMRNGRPQKVLVAGGAGFLGSHLCERLIARGDHVVCLDSFLTGKRANLRGLMGRPRFELVEADVVDPLPPKVAAREFTRIYNL